MKLNRILSEIIRGEWALDINQIHNYYPIAIAALEGNSFGLSAIGKSSEKDSGMTSLLSFVDYNNRPLQRGDEYKNESIAVVTMIGEIVKYGDSCIYGADEIVMALRIANSNPNVSAIILKIDGPGGSVSAIGPFMEFVKEKKKPIGIHTDNAMSLHYWTACIVGDFIMAENTVTSRFGSIGVFSTLVDNRKAMEDKGYKIHEIYAPESQHKNEAVRLALEGKYDMIKAEHLSPTARKFQQAVIDSRPNLLQETGVLTGKTFPAEEALRLKMIDGIGTMQEAILKVLLMTS